MHNLVLIIPSRGRPRAAREAAMSAIETRGSLATRIVVTVDGDDDPAYLDCRYGTGDVGVHLFGAHRGMVVTLNRAAEAHGRFASHIAFAGDDHRFRTPGWDTELAKSAGRWGVAYGDDLNMGERLPTSVIIAAPVVRALGYMAPGVLGHLYVDDFWRALGERLGALSYRDDIVIEHMHPSVGKSSWDEQYRRVNSSAQYERDETEWRAYRDGGGLDLAVARVRAARDAELAANMADAA